MHALVRRHFCARDRCWPPSATAHRTRTALDNIILAALPVLLLLLLLPLLLLLLLLLAVEKGTAAMRHRGRTRPVTLAT
jgi:hypothetical protein